MSVAARLRNSFPFWLCALYLSCAGLRLFCTVAPGGGAFREERGFALAHVLRMSRPLLDADRSRELAHYLKDAQSAGLVDHFELLAGGHTEIGGSKPPTRPLLTESMTDTDGWVWGRAEGGAMSLRLASGWGWRVRLVKELGTDAQRLPFEIAFLALATLAGLWFQVRARRQAAWSAVEGLPRREPRRGKTARAEASRAPATRTGVFEGICGRSGVLNLAELLESGNAEKHFAALEEFYADAAALLARYQGRLHGVHGHELLYTFADSDRARETRLAASAARDLSAAAARRGFHLGTVLSAGILHATHLHASDALFGAPVEESSQRMQALAAERGRSAIWLSEPVARQFRGELGALRAGWRSLSIHAELAPALARAQKEGIFGEMAFHRSDESLAETLQSLARDANWSRENFVGAVTELRRVSCRRCGLPVVDAYRALLVAELARKDTYRLSSVIALGSVLVTRGLVDRGLERLFLQAATVKDRRVRANAVELFTNLFPEREIPELRSLIRDEDNRVSANALIKAACERFDDRVIARLDERVHGGSVAHVASALHAMGEIALYYRRHDPLFLGTKQNFIRLFDGVPHWVEHPNTMIRRQALLAARKLQSEGLDARLRECFSLCTDPELLSLFASAYGWRKDAERVAA